MWEMMYVLEVEVTLAFAYLAEVALDTFLEVFFAEGLGKLLEETQAFFLGGGAGIVLKILAEGEHGVGFAELLDETGLGEVHEVGTHTAFAVAARAEAGDIATIDHHADDLVEGAVVAKGELGAGGTRLLVGLGSGVVALLVVAAGVGLGGGTDLADAVFHQFVAHLGTLAGGDDDACIGHGDADDGDNLHEVLVADGVRDVLGKAEGRAFGGLDAGEADGVGTTAVHR